MALTAEQQAMDFNPELQGLSRERKLAELLTGKGFEQPQGQMVSGYYVPPSFTQQLNPIANILAGQAVGERVDTKQTKMAEMLRTQGDAAVQKVMATFKQNPQLGVEQAAQLQQYPQVKALLPRLSEAAIQGKTSGIQEFEYGLNDPRFVQQQNQKAAAGATKLAVALQNQLPFQEQIQQEMGKDLIKEYSNLKSIPSQIQNLDKVEKLAVSPAYLGSGAEAKLAITKFFNNNLGTNINADKVANTEEMRSALFQSTMENLKKVDAQPSQMQQQIMQQAFGTIGTDPSAIPKIVAVYKDILTSKAIEHNARVKQSEEGPAKMKYAYDITVKLPEPTKAPVGGAFPNINYQSLDAILNARGVK
jgi:hypothetical protein